MGLNTKYERLTWFFEVQDRMTKAQLKEFADSYEIDVDITKKKENLIEQINSSIQADHTFNHTLSTIEGVKAESGKHYHKHRKWPTKEPDELIWAEEEKKYASLEEYKKKDNIGFRHEHNIPLTTFQKFRDYSARGILMIILLIGIIPGLIWLAPMLNQVGLI